MGSKLVDLDKFCTVLNKVVYGCPFLTKVQVGVFLYKYKLDTCVFSLASFLTICTYGLAWMWIYR